MRKKILTLVAGLLLAVSPAAAGRGEGGDWELGPYAGFGWLDDYDVVRPDDDMFWGLRVGYFFNPLWSLEGSWQKLSTETNFPGGFGIPDEDVDIDSLRLNILWNFRAGEACRPFLTVGLGNEKVDIEDIGDSSDLGINAGGGLRWFFGDTFGVRLDGRYVSVDVGDDIDERQSNIEGAFGLLWAFGGGPPADADNDGVTDRKDKCPNTPVGSKVDATGCPIDSDGDGVNDGVDRCANTPKGYPVDDKGCPTDTDGDGVMDGEDTCPGTPKGAKVDSKGCTSDSDDDGVFDGLDRCAGTPKGARVDAYGCPIDSDHDGVYDGFDQCPDTRPGVRIDSVGCPEKAAPLFEMDKKSLVLEGVNFETNKAELTSDSGDVLDRVAISLKDWPEVRVEIGGHTDSSGSAAHNHDLSHRRAVAVMNYLIAKGIDASRLVAKGYGEAKPIADNKTVEGKAQNRRVELVKLD